MRARASEEQYLGVLGDGRVGFVDSSAAMWWQVHGSTAGGGIDCALQIAKVAGAFLSARKDEFGRLSTVPDNNQKRNSEKFFVEEHVPCRISAAWISNGKLLLVKNQKGEWRVKLTKEQADSTQWFLEQHGEQVCASLKKGCPQQQKIRIARCTCVSYCIPKT